MTREHIGIASALQIPVAIVLTKVDITPEDVRNEVCGAVVLCHFKSWLRAFSLTIGSDLGRKLWAGW